MHHLIITSYLGKIGLCYDDCHFLFISSCDVPHMCKIATIEYL